MIGEILCKKYKQLEINQRGNIDGTYSILTGISYSGRAPKIVCKLNIKNLHVFERKLKIISKFPKY